MKKLWIKAVSLLLCTAFVCGNLISCKSFEELCKTTEDGFTYYYGEASKGGVYIVDIPDTEELVIPEYIDGYKVSILGGHEWRIGYTNFYYVYGTNTKKLTIQHPVYIGFNDRGDVNFPNLTHLTFIDFLYVNQKCSKDELMVPHYAGARTSNFPRVELKNSGREFSLEEFKPKTILIPEYVEVIEAGVFDGLTDVTIKTSFESKPEGWEEGWNGDCEVIWGENITYLDWIKTADDGFKYYYDAERNEGVYILDIVDNEKITIPEYINGNKVVKLGHRFEDPESDYYFRCANTKELTVQHEFYIQEGKTLGPVYHYYVSFPNLTKLIFIDFMYCNLSVNEDELTVPYFIGEDTGNVPTVELRKSDRVYSLNNFKPKVIVIPEYVKVIE